MNLKRPGFLLGALMIVTMIVMAGCASKSYSTTTTIQAVEDNAGDTMAVSNTFRCTHSLNVKNVSTDAKRIAMWLPVPQTMQDQTITGLHVVTAAGSYKIEQDPELGNKFLYCEIPNSGKQDYSISYEFVIQRNRQELNTSEDNIHELSASDAQEMNQYLGVDRNVTVNSEIRNLADTICGTETHPVKQARLVYEWIIDHGEYWKKDKSRYAPSGHGNTMYFLQKKTGNCTDFHAMFLSLMRARGVPSRIWFGSVFWEDKEGTGADVSYHCWPEFYAPGHGWVVVDASQADFAPAKHDFYFGNLETRRINFTQGRDINLAPRQHTGTLEYFATAYVEVDGKPHKDFERSLTFDKVE